MSAYIPKIVIAQFSNVNKVKFENANGEMQMLIEKDLISQEPETEDPADSLNQTTSR